MAASKKQFDYQAKANELEVLLARLQNPEIQIDEATKLHTEGIQLISELETYLEQAENDVRSRLAQE